MSIPSLRLPDNGEDVAALFLDGRQKYLDITLGAHGKPAPDSPLERIGPLHGPVGNVWSDEQLGLLNQTISVMMVGASEYMIGLAALYSSCARFPLTRSHVPVIRSFTEAVSQVVWLLRPLVFVAHSDGKESKIDSLMAWQRQCRIALARVHLLRLGSLAAKRNQVRQNHDETSNEYKTADQKVTDAKQRARDLFHVTDFTGGKRNWSIIGEEAMSYTDQVELAQNVAYEDQDGPNAYVYLSGEAHSSLYSLFASMKASDHGDHQHYEMQTDNDGAIFLASFTLHLWARATEMYLGAMGLDDQALADWEESCAALS